MCVHVRARDGSLFLIPCITPGPYIHSTAQDPRQFYYYKKEGAGHIGQVKPVDRVTIVLLGAHLMAEGEDCRNGHLNDQDDGLCVETTFLSASGGAANTGKFSFDFSKGHDGRGRMLWGNGTWYERYEYLKVTVCVCVRVRLRVCVHVWTHDSVSFAFASASV